MMPEISVAKPKEKIKRGRIAIYSILLLILIVSIWGVIRPIPKNISYIGTAKPTSDVKFLYDLTYKKDSETVHEQKIFNEVFRIIKDADKFIAIDMFLYNDDYDRKNSFPDLSKRLTDALIEKKAKNPDIKINVITDEINTFYGVYPSKYLEQLKNNGINVIVTDMTKLRDSNPTYSGFWRTFVQWFGTSGKGWIKNPFSPDSPKVTLRGYLRLLNFKANHRKVVITDKEALVTSANPHDASGNHSNIAFVTKGGIIDDLLKSESAVAELSGGKLLGIENIKVEEKTGDYKVLLVTEAKIREKLIEAIDKAQKDDKINMGMFYLSDRGIVKSLINASNRGADIKLVLDANKDAFGIEKNGVPNRPVADEIYKKTNGNVKIRWYSTHGEQFHTKLTMIEYKDQTAVFGGSANLTRRNVGDMNLETDLYMLAPNNSSLVADLNNYFDRIWTNKDGEYTLDFEKYHETSLFKTIMYRFQEWSGLSTF